MNWFILALIAPAFWAITNLLDDNLLSTVYKNSYVATLTSGLLGMLPLLSLFFVDIQIPPLKIALFGVAAGFLIVSSYWFYFHALAREVPSVVASLFSMIPALVLLLAAIFLKEHLTAMQYVGFVLLLAASAAISAIDIRRFRFSSALYMMFIACLMLATSAILAKELYNNVPFWSGFMFVSLGMGVAGVLFSVAFKEGREFFTDFGHIRKYLLVFIAVEAVNIFAVILSNAAFSQGPASLVSVISGIQPIYVLLYALLLFPFFPKYFREASHGHVAKKLLLMVLMVIGLYLIYP